ncbi:TPA: hypothetical protein JLK75_004809 [Escherichia coli]|nr:hypothetical protein [Escherichia coli]
MFFLRKIIPFIFISSFSVNADIEEVQQFLFRPQGLSVATEEDTLTIDDKGETTFGIKIYSGSTVTTLASACIAETMQIPIEGYTRWWLLIPSEEFITAGGLRYKISNLDWEPAPQGADKVPGFEAYVSPIIKRIWNDPNHPLHYCWDVGSEQSSTAVVRRWTAKLSVDRGAAEPGDYSLYLPLRIGWEENKGGGFIEGEGWIRYPSILYQEPETGTQINVKVVSKCSFNASPISLSHGTMTGRNADGNQTPPYNLNLTCTPGTSLSVKLIGMQEVPGKTNNFTQCGTGGMCELTFDNDKYNETMTIDNSKTLSIKSTYHLKDITKPVAESFEGNGVLQVLVN